MTGIDGDRLPTLTTPRLRLRWLEDDDVPALFSVFSDPEVVRYWSSVAWKDETAGHEKLSVVRRGFADGTIYQWGLCRADDVVIGTCTLADINTQNRRAEIGFIMGRSHWGKGYMQEALRELLRFAFEELELHRIEADVHPDNNASIRLLETLGFKREGYLRERWMVGSELSDTVFYGLLRREWSGAV